MATAIYKRVSTRKQEKDGVSLETQQEKLEAYCTIKDFTNVKEYMDIGTGRNTERADYQRLMKDIESGKISNLVIFKLDRLTRSIGDLHKLLKKLAEHNCALHSATESLDTSTANGRMMVNIIGVFAQWESETISERVSVNMYSMFKKGIWMSSVPFGFYLGKDRRLKIKVNEATIVREAFDLVLNGHSFASAEKIVTKKYSLNWNVDYLTRKLRYASTVGDMERNGEINEGTHEGIITKPEQAKLLTILNDNMTARLFIDRDDLFSRRVICPQCEGILVVRCVSHNNYKTKSFSYTCDRCYRAKRPFVSVSEKIIEEAFLKKMHDTKVGKLNVIVEDETAEEIKTLQATMIKLLAQKDKIQRAWILDNISDEDLEGYKVEIDEELDLVGERLTILKAAGNMISQEKITDLISYFNDHFEELTREEKISFVQQNVRSINFKRELVKGYKKKYEVTVTNVDFF